MNLLFVLMPLLLQGGVIKESFRVAEAEPRHHQICLRAVMASDGRFGIAWVDSLQLPDHYELDMFVRFFDSEGNHLTDAYKIAGLTDTTTWVYHPRLDMDSAGNAVLVWIDGRTMSSTKLSTIRFQAFAPDGTPLDSAKTLYSEVDIGFATPVSLANNGEFAMVFATRLVGRGAGIWVQRFDLEGIPQDSAFLAHVNKDSISDTLHLRYPQVALNDAGDLVVTWLHCIDTPHMYPRFQVFDADDEPILPWEPLGHRLDDGGEQCGACRPEPHWLDNDRFVVFYSDYYAPRPTPSIPVLGRVFSNRGLTRHPIRTLMWGDSLRHKSSDPRGKFSTAVSPNDSFAYTHPRKYTYVVDSTVSPWIKHKWEHAAGILGEVVNNEPWRRTNLFEYTPPWGADTVFSNFDYWDFIQTPAVGCCDDRLVWVYSRLNTDTIFEAYAVITDWDMGVGIEESLSKIVSPIYLEASLNRLSYDVSGSVTGEAKLTLYSADGRKVLEETIKGEGIWTPSSPSSPPSSLPSGVYFARVTTEGYSARTKVVVLR